MTTGILTRSFLLFNTTILLLLSHTLSYGQYSSQNNISFESAFSSGENLPFWFTHNQYGKYPLSSKANQMMELSSHHRVDSLGGSSFGIKGGFDILGLYYGKFDYQINELYAGASLWGFKLEGGLFRDTDYFEGLSSTNGQMDKSLNSMPYPRIRLATEGFIPFFFWKDNLSFKAEYDEGLLGKNSRVVDAKMHHKLLHFKYKFKNESYFTIGLNHFVQWGGVSNYWGQMPEDFDSYLRYITGRTGNSNFSNSDQLNAAGNQYGTYYMEYELKREKYNLRFYYSHPFEDHSGMEMDNWRDNLLGAYIDFKKDGIVEKVVYEFMYTKHQSGPIHEYHVMRGIDDYYNHGTYATGATYEGYALCSPLISPVRFEDGISTGLENNRLTMHHIAAKGTIYQHLEWLGMITYTNNLGTYITPYEAPRDQVSTMFSFSYCNPKFPVDITMSVAGDFGEMYEDRVGVMLKVGKRW
ncbi:MAG: hypothetical protein KA807_17140 [Prolixibacteraceae bacterium]|nr:hypothetical protein [Prolixibacteraceae bacterium]